MPPSATLDVLTGMGSAQDLRFKKRPPERYPFVPGPFVTNLTGSSSWVSVTFAHLTDHINQGLSLQKVAARVGGGRLSDAGLTLAEGATDSQG
jgi:hypothetical protein